MRVDGVGENTAILIKLMMPIIRMYTNDKLKQNKKFDSADEIGEYLTKKYIGYTKEIFAIVSLNNKGAVIAFDVVSEGDMVEVPISVRNVIETVLKRNATAVILSHNHPGGQAIPSAADIETTKILCDALRNIGVAVLDHYILCDDDYVSLAISQNYKHLFKF